jgi:HK97 family phage prohead protease
MDEKLKKLLAEYRAKYVANKKDHPWSGTVAVSVKALGDYQIEAIIATNSIDRHGEILEIDGVDLKQYKKNPVVLWAHDYSQLPMAKSISIKKQDGKIISKMEFNPNDEESMKKYDAYKNGFVNAFSIGFIPTDGVWDEKINGYRWTKSEMIEYSGVPVPANAEALVQAKSFLELGILKAEASVKTDESDEDEDISEDEDIDPDKPEIKAINTKAGKVLSADNRKSIEAAVTALQAVLAADAGEEKSASSDLTDILSKASSATGDLLAQATEQGSGRSPEKQKILLVKAKKTAQIVDKTAELLIAQLNKQIKN